MNMTSEQAPTQVPVTILHLSGEVDGSNYRSVISQASELYQAGARRLLIDLTGVSYMSSAGLVALNSTAMLFSGQEAPDPEHGWRALHAVGESARAGVQPHVKLLNPAPRVRSVLEQTGLVTFIPVFEDQAAALASF